MAATAPPSAWIPITPNDGADITRGCRALLVQVGGNIVYQDAGGTQRTIAVPAGVLPIADVKRILATSTTATGISAAYDIN